MKKIGLTSIAVLALIGQIDGAQAIEMHNQEAGAKDADNKLSADAVKTAQAANTQNKNQQESDKNAKKADNAILTNKTTAIKSENNQNKNQTAPAKADQQANQAKKVDSGKDASQKPAMSQTKKQAKGLPQSGTPGSDAIIDTFKLITNPPSRAQTEK